MHERLKRAIRAKTPAKERLRATVADGIYPFWIVTASLVGVLCLFAPDFIYRRLPYLFGIPMILGGAMGICASIHFGEYQRKETKLISTSLISALVGCAIIAAGSKADGLIGCVWGVVGFAKASEELNESIFRMSHHEKWVGKLVTTCVEFILALALIFDPVKNVRAHTVVLGCESIVLAVQFSAEYRDRRKNKRGQTNL